MKILIYLLFILQFIYINSRTFYIGQNNITIIGEPRYYGDTFILLNGTYSLSSQIKVIGSINVADNSIVEFISSSDDCILKLPSSFSYIKGPIVFRDSNCGIEIQYGSTNTIEDVKIYNMKKYGIIASNFNIIIKNCEIDSIGKIGIKIENNCAENKVINTKISNTKIGISNKGNRENIIDSNVIYNSTEAIYLTDEFQFYYNLEITNNIFINVDNVIYYHHNTSYENFYVFTKIIGNTIFKPRTSVFNFEDYIKDTGTGNKLMNNFIYIPKKNSITINNLDKWEIKNNYFYNIDSIDNKYSNNSIFYKGDLEKIFSNYQGSCNYKTDTGNILPECFRPNKWYKEEEYSLYEKGIFFGVPTNDFEGNQRSKEKQTIGAYENFPNFDSAIEININYCIYDDSNKINMYGKKLKKYYGSLFLEFYKVNDCLWKYNLIDMPDISFEFKFIILENKSILKFGKTRKMDRNEIIALSTEENGTNSEFSYSFDKGKNVYILTFDWK